ncbi:MAG: hypothetical protein E2O45_00670 [Nitrospina sp.]|nr:MAG: hypothetical protein E2O45_00670 [Nitrospina sp.]
MDRTTPNSGRRLAEIAGTAMLVLTLAGPATAMEDVYSSPSCKLYAGEKTVESLQQREAVLKDALLPSPVDGGDLCERANIHYRLSRMLPDRQVQYLISCIGLSQRAIVRDAQAGVAYFFKGLCVGRLGEMRGVWGSLKTIEPFRKNMEAAAQINPAIDRGGPHRALGRFYFKLPRILGGDIQKSIDHLLQAVSYGPVYWENHFFLAESYFENRQYIKARAELQQAVDIASRLNDDNPESKTRTVEFQGLMQAIERNIH